MHVRHVPDQRAVGQEGNVHGREGKQRVQDVVIGGTNSDDAAEGVSWLSRARGSMEDGVLRGNLSGPEGETIGVDSAQLMADGSNMMNQPEIVGRQKLRSRGRVDVEAGEREYSRLLPLLNLGFDLRRPHEVRLVRAGRPLIRKRHVVVGASNLVLGAVAALREILIAPDVPTFAKRSYQYDWARGIVRRRIPTRFHIPYGTWCDWRHTVSYLVGPRATRIATYLRRGGPPPGPDIAEALEGEIVLTRELDVGGGQVRSRF